MSFGVGKFNLPSKNSFGKDLSKGFTGDANFNKVPDWELDTNAFKFTPKDNSLKSRIRFYDHDSSWIRWRRGYELYTITQNTLGSFANERFYRGDYRLYCAVQQFPGVFASARLFTFPSANQEIGTQLVAMRDTNAFNFYNYGIPILGVRYLGPSSSGTYSQSGTTITVTKQDHGFLINESVSLVFSTGAGVDETLVITSVTNNTFTLTATSPVTTNGNVTFYLSTTFDDSRWISIRTKLQNLPTSASFLVGERLVDRIIEQDPGVVGTYTRIGVTVSVTCSTDHGLSTGNAVNLTISSGGIAPGRYIINVTSSTQFTVTTVASGAATGSLVVSRLIPGYRYDDYVGYTMIDIDTATNELIFQRKDSYGGSTFGDKLVTTVPAHRGFLNNRFLTTELRWQCSCQDFTRRSGYDFYSEVTNKRFPVTAITSTKPGQVLEKDNSLSNERDLPGNFSDLGYTAVNNFYQLPEYEDTASTSYTNLEYYQLRWCKHIYAALFALVHDEGNEPLALLAKYSQSGPNITVDFPNHNLTVNTKIELTFTSGNALSGQYTITSVPNPDSFVVVYPFSETTSGYCTVSNLKEHSYVNEWLLEPNDRPVGDDLDTFYRNFDKEIKKIQLAAERLVLIRQGSKWVGSRQVVGSFNLPEEIANYDPELITMLITDSIRRGIDGSLDRDGILVNNTNRLISVISKLFNLEPTQISDTKIGLLDQPLFNYSQGFNFILIDGGTYANGEPVESSQSLTTIDCETYSPRTAQDTEVDCGFYINI
jgi:hypothetical protein